MTPTTTMSSAHQLVDTPTGQVVVSDDTTAHGWVLSPTGHDTAATRVGTGDWVVVCARCGPRDRWVSPGAALQVARSHAMTPPTTGSVQGGAR